MNACKLIFNLCMNACKLIWWIFFIFFIIFLCMHVWMKCNFRKCIIFWSTTLIILIFLFSSSFSYMNACKLIWWIFFIFYFIFLCMLVWMKCNFRKCIIFWSTTLIILIFLFSSSFYPAVNQIFPQLSLNLLKSDNIYLNFIFFYI